jgi:hypothetical protein
MEILPNCLVRFQVNENGYFAAFLISDISDTGHGSLSFKSTRLGCVEVAGAEDYGWAGEIDGIFPAKIEIAGERDYGDGTICEAS